MMRPIVAAGWLCLLLLCCGALAAAPDASLPSARCLTADGKELDFADLVARECNKKDKKPPTSPEPPTNAKPGPGPKAPSGVTVTVTEAEKGDKGSKGDCERGVTARELQRNIVAAADARCVAQILIQTGSVGGIEDGFRIDPDFNFRPNCGKRELDPDVVALKGIALGLLQAPPREGGRDGGIVDKVADGVVPSFTPPGERFSDVSKKDMVDRDAFADVLRNSTLMTETFNEDANNSPPCKKTPTKPRKPYSGRRSLLSDLFSGRHAGVFAAEEFVGSSARRLQCADCDNGDSFPCAYCWQQDVCGDMYWCQG